MSLWVVDTYVGAGTEPMLEHMLNQYSATHLHEPAPHIVMNPNSPNFLCVTFLCLTQQATALPAALEG